MPTSQAEQLQKIDEKMSQLKARRQAIVNRDKEKERKERTRRLIQNGAIAEQYLNCEGIQPDALKSLFDLIVNSKDFPGILEQAKKELAKT